MYQTSSNTFHSQQHILAEWVEQCGGYINQLSKYSMSVSVCVCVQTLTSAKTGRASTTRCVYRALAVSPACVNQATLVSCVRQVSSGFHSPGESRHLPSEEIFSSAFYINLSHLAAVFVQSFPVFSGSKLRFWLKWFANNRCFFLRPYSVAMNQSKKVHWTQVGFLKDCC